ncbi:hypothetical protein [Sphingomonas sp.]|jgi:hypothetical protein|uniref:hypothetical protein n=1 Tax=Sphingomonas sp. TaxID=28214 RepID=UPI0035C86B71
MADSVDEAMIIAWVDGELDDATAARVAARAAAEPALRELAERHRAMKARFAAAFDPLARSAQTVSSPTSPAPAPIISLAAVRAERAAAAAPSGTARRGWWGVGGAIAASLIVGVVIGHNSRVPVGLGDRTDALALAAPIGGALDRQLSGEAGPIRVNLSFRAQDGRLCRRFTGQHVAGVACRGPSAWQLRYAVPVTHAVTDYRMAGDDDATAQVVDAMIAGEPLDRAAEEAARRGGWR